MTRPSNQSPLLVTASSRLHFGMFSFGRSDTRQYGGVGAMIAQPGLRLVFRPAEKFAAAGPLAERVARFASQMAAGLGLAGEPPCQIEVLSAPREHVGLGVGTQLAMSVAAGLNALLGGAEKTLEEWARITGRGRRSAIGLHGFAQGGFLIESGKYADDLLSPLAARADLPPAWRFVLLLPAGEGGLSGPAEETAFARLAPPTPETTARLAAEALLHLLPAARQADFDAFSESLFRFGRLAGRCFAAEQDGVYGTERQARRVEMLREMGVRGVAQSSWGPVLAALLPDEPSATRLVETLAADADNADLELVVSPPANQGAVVTSQ